MEWLAIPIVLFLVWAFFNLNVFGRRQKRSDIGHAVWSMLVLVENGGWLSIKVRNSPIVLRVVREHGVDPTATLSLRVPKAWWAYVAEQEIRNLCNTHGYDGDFSADPAGDSVCKIRLAVNDIWNEAAGAPAARLVHLVLDALEVPRDARFKLDIVGPRSWRGYDHERALRREGENQ